MPLSGPTSQIGTFTPALFTCASIVPLTRSWQATSQRPVSSSGATPMAPSNWYVFPYWSCLVRLAPAGYAHLTMYLTISRPPAVVMSPLVLESPPTVSRPLRERLLRERPLRERPLRERPLRERPLRERPLRERPLRERPLRERPLRPSQPLRLRPFKDRPLTDST